MDDIKMTKSEIVEGIYKYVGAGDGVKLAEMEIYIGRDSDGNIIAVLVVDNPITVLWTAFPYSVVKLAESHSQKYIPYVMGQKLFQTYCASNGFVAVVEREFPIMLQWGVDVELWMREDLGQHTVTDAELEAWCVEVIKKLDGRNRPYPRP